MVHKINVKKNDEIYTLLLEHESRLKLIFKKKKKNHGGDD